MLEHEREALSRSMAFASAYQGQEEYDGIMHDLEDIDYFLQVLEVRVIT